MNNIQILDCTLRDGGYINKWNFKKKNIQEIIRNLVEANIDIIECGFLEDFDYNEEYSLFSHVDQIKKLLPLNRENTMFVAMTRLGSLDLDTLETCSNQSINGIRVTFHKEEINEAIEYCKLIQEKGYKVFVQPVGTTDYSDLELLELINLVNMIQPYGFYIVDTLGLMTRTDILHTYYLINNNLNKDVRLGFHSHNNMQLSFSNAQELIDINGARTIIIDASVYGMGRGAGNLNTELITEYLNRYKNTNYITNHILEIIDEIIEPIKQKYSWGYSAQYYMASIHGCHPNYATYLLDKKTIPVLGISKILSLLEAEKKSLFDEKYIESEYLKYQENLIEDKNDLNEIKKLLEGRNLLILAPGSSLKSERERIEKYINDNSCLVISVNFESKVFKSDISFYSNSKRVKQLELQEYKEKRDKVVITTSNVSNYTSHFKLNYSSLINSEPLVSDNAALMLINLLTILKIGKVSIAGLDGYSLKGRQHYADPDLETNLDFELLESLNIQMKKVLEKYKAQIDLFFITETVYCKDDI